MNIVALFNALPGGCAQGLIWGIMAIGVFITYKILDLADLTVDGTMCTGGAVCVVMMMNGHSWIFPVLRVYRRHAGWSGNGHFPYDDGNSGDSGRYSDPAGSVFHQLENYGQQGQCSARY